MIELETLHQDTIAVLTLRRPPASAFTPEGLLQLQGTVGRLDADAYIRALVVAGDGPEFFSAGADLSTFVDDDRDAVCEAAARFGTVFETLRNACPVVITTTDGFTMGDSLECVFVCDTHIAETHARLAIPETAVSPPCCGCGTQMLPWFMSESWAKCMILTGECVDAQTALRIGLAEKVAETGTAREATIATALRVITLSP